MGKREFEAPMELEDFAEGRKGWTCKIEDDNSGIAQRVFEYPANKSALLWIHLATPRFAQYEAHINIPFSAGPEESYSARYNPTTARTSKARFKPVEEWVIEREKLLMVPLQIAEAKTYAVAEGLATSMGSRGLYMASYIFDIDFDNSSAQLIRQLIRKCAPRLVRQVRGV